MNTLFTDQRHELNSAFAGQDLPVSIIIVNYNSGNDLSCCLQSLFEMDMKDAEIVVVDNASTDGSLVDIQSSFPQVHWISSSTNLGFGAACNLASGWGRGKYLAFLNPDTQVTPGWLDKVIAVLDANPKVGMVTPKILLKDSSERINTCGNDVHISGLTLCRGLGASQNEYNHMEAVDAVSGAAFVIRKELFELQKGFDECYFLYMEDTDLSWRVRLNGWQILFVPQAVVFHDYRLCFGPGKVFFQERNRYMMLLKCLEWRSLLALLPALLLAEIVTWGFCLLSDRHGLWEKCQAYVWLISNWRSVMKARRQTQSLRQVPDEFLLRTTSYRLMFEQTCNGFLAKQAHHIFDPLFAICKAIALFIIHKSS